MSKKLNLNLFVIHGPNLNLLGKREQSIYGMAKLKDIDSELKLQANKLGVRVKTFQSNSEGEIVSAIQKADQNFCGLLINAAGYTHTSVAIRDALLAIKIPTIEIHLSNIYKREEFRHHSFISPVVLGQIAGFGPQSYILGLQALVHHLRHAGVMG